MELSGLHFEFDAYTPKQIRDRVENAAVRKTRETIAQAFLLAVLAGAFIALGALFYTITITGSSVGFGVTRLIGGFAFSLGLLLVVVAGAELFTGNNLMVMAYADGRIGPGSLIKGWILVYLGNLFGALGTAVLVCLSGVLEIGGGAVAQQADIIAQSKLDLNMTQAFFRGVLCNVLVCLAVWLTFAGRSVTDKAVAIVFPISAFVACGFEHSVANMYLIPVAMLSGSTALDLMGFGANLLTVTLGNILGGGFLVAFVYWVIYHSEPN